MTRSEEPGVDPFLEVRERRRGRRPGDAYVRIVRPFDEEFERSEAGNLVATAETLYDRGGWRTLVQRLRHTLIGHPISSEREEHERLSKTKALAVFSSDNISSSAYATEEMMRILILAGVGAVSLLMPLTLVIAAVLAIVATSYRQTIRAYPTGASSYIVAGDNLGVPAGLVAAAALLIDYTLTVAVSVSAGVVAMTSIVPGLFDYRVALAVAIVGILTLGNLRGVRESGTIFMAPVYLYLVAVFGVIGFGLVAGALGLVPPYRPPADWLVPEGGALEPLGLLLILRAFSSGAVALTGVEAISDGVPAFKPPEWRNARVTLTWAAALFGALFIGISFLVSNLGIVPDPSEQQTVLSLLTRHLTGDGPFLVVVQVSTALLLALAANTSFADFPRLSSFLARDGFMPRQFGSRGDRLAFSTGIVALAGLAIALLIAFQASVSALIPLYTLGVFLAFTLSQSGMVVRWWRRREAGWRRSLAVNGVGAAVTGVIVLVVAVSKFLQGAWLVILLIPLLVGLLLAIRRHYRVTDRQLVVPPGEAPATQRRPIVIVPVARLDRPAASALAFARSIDPGAVAVHVTNQAAAADELRRRWPADGLGLELVIVESPYRAVIGPLVRYLDALQRQDPSRPLLVVLSEVVPRRWWDNLLHNQTALRLKLRLFFRPNTIVADVPFHLAAEAPSP